MRKLILLAVLTMAATVTKTMAHPGHLVDSTKIIHANDGDISEWGAGRFETDPELKLLYSIDHDNENLYMAMKITDPAMQLRIAMNGMKMFIDTRGKKKEGAGVEFPIHKDGGGFQGGRGQGGGPSGGNEGAPDPAKMQQRMAFNMIVLKIFGFDDKEDKTQFIGESGSVNIAFKWEADGSMAIEYRIPLEYVGGTSSLKNKSLSIGWKVNEGSAQATGATRTETTTTGTRELVSTTSTGGGGRRGNGAGGASSSAGGRSGGGGDPRVSGEEPKGQFIWTKHLMNF
jgi:hypothetical protein